MADISEIAAYIALDNPARAASFAVELTDAAHTLADNAHAFRLRPEHGPNIRILNHGNYLIFYTIIDDTVKVLTVRHGARRPIVFDRNTLEPKSD